MNLSDQQIHDFIDAWRKDFGETLSFDAARIEAGRLIEFFLVMEDVLRTQQALANKTNRTHGPLPIGDPHLKTAWRKTMRRKP